MKMKAISAAACPCGRLLDALASTSDLSLPTVTIIDAKWRHRRIPLSRGRHFLTRIAIPETTTSVLVESHLEYRVGASLLKCEDVRALFAQPVTVWFLFRGRVHRYTPDFLIVLRAAQRTHRAILVEVKPQARLLEPPELWQVRRAALRATVDLPLAVVTEHVLRANGGLAHG